MSNLINLDNMFDEELKKGIEQLDDVLAYFMTIENTSRMAKLITNLIHATLQIGELHEFTRE